MPNEVITGYTTEAQKAQAAANPGRPVAGHRWSETGNVVLPNNQLAIMLYCLPTEHQMRAPADVFGENAAVVKDYQQVQFLEGAVRAHLRNRSGNLAAYTADYAAWKLGFFYYRFSGSYKTWAPESKRHMEASPAWVAGITGYGQDYHWFNGSPGADYILPCLYKHERFHIGVGSHETDSAGNPVDLFLPLAPAEPPAPPAPADSDC